MKNQILCSLLLALSTFVVGQPVINSSNYNVTPGAQFIVGLFDPVYDTVPESTGSNIVWTFTSAPATEFDTIEYLLPSSTPSAADFTAATVCVHRKSEPNDYHYYITTGSDVSYIGNAGHPLLPYDNDGGLLKTSNYDIQLVLPFTFQDDFQDSWLGELGQVGSSRTVSGTDSVTVDGYGTLNLPNANYSDVVKIKRRITSSDSAGTTQGNCHFTSHEWYKAGINIPILSQVKCNCFYGNFGQSSYRGFYLLNNPLSVSENRELKFTMLPNPTTDRLFIYSEDFQISEVSIYSINGNLLLHQAISSDNSLDISRLISGVYVVEIKNRETSVKKRFIKM